MENEKVLKNDPENDGNFEQRLKTLAEKSDRTVEELLCSLEESATVIAQNDSAKSRSTGSQSSESDPNFDPTGSEFLKGIWGK